MRAVYHGATTRAHHTGAPHGRTTRAHHTGAPNAGKSGETGETAAARRGSGERAAA
jgi:hypothetical protein